MKLFSFFLCIYFLFILEVSPAVAFVPPVFLKKVSLRHAQYFEIYQNKFTYLVLLKKNYGNSESQCVLVGDIDVKINGCPTVYKFKRPISSLGSSSSTHIGFLKELKSLDKLKAFGPRYLLKEDERKDIIDLGANIDIKSYLKSPIELFLSYQFGDFFFGKSRIIQRFSTPILFINDFKEGHPLARAEWLKVFGVLCGKFEESEKKFSEIESQYWKTVSLARAFSFKNTPEPEVIYGHIVGNNFSVVTNKDFYFYIFKDLNIKLVNSNESLNSFSRMRFLNFESIYHHLERARFWFNPNYSSFSRDFLINNKFRKFQSVIHRNLYMMSLKMGRSYWENISSRPDKILFDLYQTIFLNKKDDPLSFFVRFK